MPIVFKEKVVKLIGNNYPELEILHLSDIHLKGPSPSLEKILKERISQRIYDLIFLTGDLIEREDALDYLIGYISLLRAKYGIFAVWGNHDKFQLKLRHIFNFNRVGIHKIPMTNFQDYKRKMERKGIRVLSNELETLLISKQEVYIVGLDDLTGVDKLQDWDRHKEEIARIRQLFTNIPHEKLTLTLSHLPDILERLAGLKIDIMFSGHTHGGQVRLPFFGPLFVWSSFQRKHNQGLYRYNGTYLHISPGLGTSCCSFIRFRCPPEITLIKIISDKRN